MSEEKKVTPTLPDEIIMNKIYLIRGHKVMFDRDLADIYKVETRRLKEQVRRNIKRFPSCFMFELTKQEVEDWRNQFGQGRREIMGLRILPFVFTEHGILMLANVLKSERAINMSIKIIETFVKVREMLIKDQDTLHRLERIEKTISSHDKNILLIFEYLKQFEDVKKQEQEQENRKQIGYKIPDKK